MLRSYTQQNLLLWLQDEAQYTSTQSAFCFCVLYRENEVAQTELVILAMAVDILNFGDVK